MTWPTSDLNTTTIDQGTDVPNVSRGELYNAVTRFNDIRKHFSQAIISLCTPSINASEARKALNYGTSGFSAYGAVIDGFFTGTFRNYKTTNMSGKSAIGDGGFDPVAGTYTVTEPGVYFITLVYSVPRRAGTAGVCQYTICGVASSFMPDYLIQGALTRYPMPADSTDLDYQQACTLQYLNPGEVMYVRVVENTGESASPPVTIEEFSAARLT